MPRPNAAPAPSAPKRPVSESDLAIFTEGLTKRFGSNVAVNHVDLAVPRGVAFGYLGPNGAGKTTLIRVLLGLTHADAGRMRILGVDVPHERRRALSKVGAIVEEPRFHPHLSGRDNLRIHAAVRGGGADANVESALERVGLTSRANDAVASYSMGMRQRLGVAACLLGDPDLLLLDEPMNGLDPAGIQEMRLMIRDLVAEGRTVLLSSHLLDEVERTCDAVAIVDRGRLIRQGSIDELLSTTAAGLRLDCGDPAAATTILGSVTGVAGVHRDGDLLVVDLAASATKEVAASVNRALVTAGIDVFSLTQERASLEDWFLSVTSRFGEPANA